MGKKALENVSDQVGYCGIWCGSCAVGTSALTELAARYRDLCEAHGLGEWGADGFDYDQFLQALSSIAALPGCPGCRQGGGRTDCELRACATKRGVDGCIACAEFGLGAYDQVLQAMRSGAWNAGLVVIDSLDEQPLPEARKRRELREAWWWRALHGGPRNRPSR